MKQFLALLLIVAAVFAAYQFHKQQVEAAALEAAARARAEMVRRPEPVHGVMVSRGLESIYSQAFSDLDRQQAVDLVPPLQMIREHILDAKVRAEVKMQPVYELGARLAGALVDVAEERTKALQSVLQANARPSAALDAKNTVNTTNEFFAQSSAKRWDDERRRRKPGVDALMTALRNAERSWNQHLPNSAPMDVYEPPPYQQLLITVQSTARDNPLEHGAYNQHTAYPWRASYYDQYGYKRAY